MRRPRPARSGLDLPLLPRAQPLQAADHGEDRAEGHGDADDALRLRAHLARHARDVPVVERVVLRCRGTFTGTVGGGASARRARRLGGGSAAASSACRLSCAGDDLRRAPSWPAAASSAASSPRRFAFGSVRMSSTSISPVVPVVGVGSFAVLPPAGGRRPRLVHRRSRRGGFVVRGLATARRLTSEPRA